MEKTNLTTLTPITLDKKFKDKYSIENFIDTIFIITKDQDYYYYCLASKMDQKTQMTNGIWIEKEDGMDKEQEPQKFDSFYFLSLNSIFRIRRSELESFVAAESKTRIKWETQLDIVVKIDELVNSKNKIHIVVVDNIRKNILTIN